MTWTGWCNSSLHCQLEGWDMEQLLNYYFSNMLMSASVRWDGNQEGQILESKDSASSRVL